MLLQVSIISKKFFKDHLLVKRRIVLNITQPLGAFSPHKKVSERVTVETFVYNKIVLAISEHLKN